jgi:hypothetical protein
LIEVKKSRITITHAGNIIWISIINTFETPKGFVGLFGGNCPQHCKQDLPKRVGVVFSKKNA